MYSILKAEATAHTLATPERFILAAGRPCPSNLATRRLGMRLPPSRLSPLATPTTRTPRGRALPFPPCRRCLESGTRHLIIGKDRKHYTVDPATIRWSDLTDNF